MLQPGAHIVSCEVILDTTQCDSKIQYLVAIPMRQSQNGDGKLHYSIGKKQTR